MARSRRWGNVNTLQESTTAARGCERQAALALALYRRYRPDTFDGVIGQDHVAGTEKSVRDAVQGDYVELVELPDDVVAELREIAITEIWEDLASKSERMARGIEIIKQQSRDYGRQVDY